ncbi:Fidgetin-like protein 1 [Seminavis robusta]|uniref:Fidgetin-like protein 1 n=1 Tax=Seminavis robusta TaxID=568900 RepID=A0A9N8EY68_9STRA|nr:Fidgetin-like protein 1 [Seminavis robusta]|eukprot:Sro1909_g304840.1 Fidgetin-like protein 1 (685) ;mRNA; f:14124-16477
MAKPSKSSSSVDAKHHGGTVDTSQGDLSAPERPVSQYDFATMYEEWYLLQQKVNDNNNDGPQSYFAALAARAGRMGNIQSAIMNKGPAENSGFLQGMLQMMQLEDEPNLPAALVHVPVTPSAAESIQLDQNRRVEVDMDAFFQEYPECMRSKEEYSYDDDDSDDYHNESGSSEEEIIDLQPQKKVLKTTKEIAIQTDFQPTREDGATNSFLYSQQSNNPAVQQPPTKPERHNPYKKPNSNSNDNAFYSLVPPTQFQQQQSAPENPFVSAMEFAKTSGNTAQQNHTQQQQTAFQCAPADGAEMEESDNPISNAPNIRDSLRRKFQPPKMNAQSKGNTSSSNNRQKGVAQKISGKAVAGGGGTKHDNEDDEELPEELKRFGKDLVDKIESEIMDNGEPITFHDIAGLEDAKATIQEIVCWPMLRPDLFTGLRRTPNGLLLFGPPGTGKTLIGKAIAHESKACFFSISSSSLTSKWIGEGEKLVRTMFGVAAYRQPSVVFLDEIDSLLTQRKSDDNESSRRIKTEFLVGLDGTGTSSQGRVLVIGATNRPQELDEAARRRFVKRLYIPLPNAKDRACLLKVLLEKNENTLSGQEIEKLARDTDGFSGADLKALSSDAAMGPLRQLGPSALKMELKALPAISYKHFRISLRSMNPSVGPEDIGHYEIFDKAFGSKRASMDLEDDDEED